MSVGGPPDSRRLQAARLQETRPERALPPGERGPGRLWIAGIVGLVLIFVVAGGYDLFTDRHVLDARFVVRPTVSAPHHVVRSATPSADKTGRTATARASASATASPTASASAIPVRVLSAESATAFGPDGTSDGDNPGIAYRVLTGDGTDPWQSAWYETAEFGNLQEGTGLLLDMGKPVSVSSVRLELGGLLGADVQVRLGDTPEPGDLSTAATADGVGGIVRLTPPAPVRARYVLVWFTLLPPDSTGTYQASVYSITVDGRP